MIIPGTIITGEFFTFCYFSRLLEQHYTLNCRMASIILIIIIITVPHQSVIMMSCQVGVIRTTTTRTNIITITTPTTLRKKLLVTSHARRELVVIDSPVSRQVCFFVLVGVCVLHIKPFFSTRRHRSVEQTEVLLTTVRSRLFVCQPLEKKRAG